MGAARGTALRLRFVESLLRTMQHSAPALKFPRTVDAGEIFSLPASVYVVRRFTQSGVGFHYGVLMPDRSVVDFGPDTGSVMRRQDPFEFARGRSIEVLRQVPDSEHFDAHLRMNHSLEWPRDYELAEWNCEHFATWLAGERPRSDQVVFAIIVTTAALALLTAAMLARKK